MSDEPTLVELLTAHRSELVGMFASIGRGLARYETPEDLAQGLYIQLVERDQSFLYRGQEEFRSWLRTVVRRYVADRHAHWSTLKRGSGRVARLTWGLSTQGAVDGVPVPEAQMPTPSSFASRRELLELVTRALDLLPARDRQLVRAMSRGESLQELATSLGLSYAATQRAALRAVERLRKMVQLAQGRVGR